MNKILLSFDLEEFDLPLEYDLILSREEQFKFSFQGLQKILNLLEKLDVIATFFVTSSFALEYPEIIKNISIKHEIASHSLNHKVKKYTEKETKKSKEVLEKIIKKKITGFRFPRLQKVNYKSLENLGFKYDSSICPTYIPRRYSNYLEKRKIILKENILEIPISTTPLIKIPFSWIFFRFFGLNYAKITTKFCVKNPGFVNLFFHPWEFNDLNKFKIPFYIKKNSGEKALNMIEKYIIWCKNKGYRFITFSDLVGPNFS